jgi:hypothetical protein
MKKPKLPNSGGVKRLREANKKRFPTLHKLVEEARKRPKKTDFEKLRDFLEENDMIYVYGSYRGISPHIYV